MSNEQSSPVDLNAYVEEAKRDAIFVFDFLRQSGTLSASLTFNVTHRIAGHALTELGSAQRSRRGRSKEPSQGSCLIALTELGFAQRSRRGRSKEPSQGSCLIDKLVSVRFPQPWSRDRNVTAKVTDASEHEELVINEPRLDKHPELAPPPALLESNGGANFWGKGILKTGELILLIEEAARLQAIAEQIGGAKEYTPGALDLQWKRTGLRERARGFVARSVTAS